MDTFTSESTTQRFSLLLSKKIFPTQNVLVVCSFDMKFTYVLSSWEGTTFKSKILKHVLTKNGDKLKIPKGMLIN